MIILITFVDEDGQVLVSHGVDSITLRDVILPIATPKQLGAIYNEVIGEWIII